MKNFPIYLKYSGINTWIRILSEKEWDELRILGSYYNLSHYKTITFADRNQLMDLIENKDLLLESISENDFNIVLQECFETKAKNETL